MYPPSLISQIETGKTEPSINTLFAMVSELELSVNEIVFDSRVEAVPASGWRRRHDAGRRRSGAGRLEWRPGSRGRHPVHPSSGERAERRSASSPASSWQRLTAQPDHNVDFLYLRYPPGSESTPPDSLMRHNGTEYGYILSGRLQVSIGFDTYEIGPGDTISFDCTQPHRFAAVGDETVEAVWFVVGRRNTLSVDDSSVAP